MNYLGHAVLACGSPGEVFGAVLADAIMKTTDRMAMPGDIIAGVRAHGDIDKYVDLDPSLEGARRSLGPSLGHFSAIAIDLSCDVVISKRWDDLFAESMPDFLRRLCDVIESQIPRLSDRSRATVSRILEEGHLWACRDNIGLSEAVQRIAKRARYGDRLLGCLPIIEDTIPIIEDVILNSLPGIRLHAQGAAIRFGCGDHAFARWRTPLLTREESVEPATRMRPG